MNMWNDRAMPLLLAIRDAQEDREVVDSQGPRPESLAPLAGLDEYTVRRTLQDLWDDGLITGVRSDLIDTPGFYAFAIRLTPEGLRKVDEWPSAESSFDALVEVLTEMADAEPNPDKRSRIQRLLDGAKGLPRDVAVNLGAAYLAKVSGIG